MSAQQKVSKGSVGIEAFQGRLRLRLPRQLYGGKQKYLTFGVANTPENQKLAASKAKQIELDILAGYFHATLEKYKPQTNSDLGKSSKSNQAEPPLNVLWDRYAAYKSKTLSVTTSNKDYKRIKNHIANLPTQKLADAVPIRDFLLSQLSANSAKRVLTQLNACCDWAVDSGLITKNPFDEMAQTVKTLAKDEEDSINPFTRDEQERIIAAFAKHRYYQHYTSYVRFLFMTGCRPKCPNGNFLRSSPLMPPTSSETMTVPVGGCMGIPTKLGLRQPLASFMSQSTVLTPSWWLTSARSVGQSKICLKAGLTIRF